MKVQSSKSFHFYGICALMVTLVRLDIYTLIHTLDYISIAIYKAQKLDEGKQSTATRNLDE